MIPLLKDLTLIFKLCQGQVQSFNDKHRLWTGESGFWVIQNNTPLIDRIGKINKRNIAKSIMTFHFSTLYTKIPHDLLILALNEIIDFFFRVEYPMLYMLQTRTRHGGSLGARLEITAKD